MNLPLIGRLSFDASRRETVKSMLINKKILQGLRRQTQGKWTYLSALQSMIMLTERVREDTVLVLQTSISPHWRVSDSGEASSN